MKLPQYKQLQNQLKEQILAGVYQNGDLLPSENELSTLRKIRRVTVKMISIIPCQNQKIQRNIG